MKKRENNGLEGSGSLPELREEDESFLARWSRRKQATVKGEEIGHEPAPRSEVADLEPAAPIPVPPELTDADMPPIESLDENSDYSGFLSPKVSEELRRLALRKLFHLSQFNVSDGLNDYDEDYTKFKELGDIVTHEMRRLLEQEKERALAARQGGGEDSASGRRDAEVSGQSKPGYAGQSGPEDPMASADPEEDPPEDMT